LAAYVPRKRFRSPKSKRRAELAAARQRRWRLYEAAVKAGHPLALEAEAWRNPMSRYYAKEKSLSLADRKVLLEQCQALHGTPEARAKYQELREQVIAEVSAIFS
jgi:hypothetical protein